MLISGFQKTSFVDYPGQPCAVVFTPYCNFNCAYCHNAHILGRDASLIPEEPIWEYLEKRAGLLHALVVSGGEPTLQQNLEPFLERARLLGYRIKLDTNGSKPAVLQQLLNKGLVDYVAMDVKAPPEKYDEITGSTVDMDAIRKSIAILRNGAVAHEFRLTFFSKLTPDDARNAAKLVKGCQRFFLQQYRPRFENDPPAYAPKTVLETAWHITEEIGVCTVRGLGPEQDGALEIPHGTI
ncbi:MAG: anaerobic ribonucleoside-triphosphate reductase activating protein [Eubacteriales bacterium]|nr:anaerobic ribonucleoside-triphosphate reductase activating protein [Eubacteriales bacterium]